MIDKALYGEKEWYFFSPRDRKYPNGMRPNRAAGSGYWKATGTDKLIVAPPNGNESIGVKKALVFYKGRPPKGIKTGWIMHEYRLTRPPVGAIRPAKITGDSSMRVRSVLHHHRHHHHNLHHHPIHHHLLRVFVGYFGIIIFFYLFVLLGQQKYLVFFFQDTRYRSNLHLLLLFDIRLVLLGRQVWFNPVLLLPRLLFSFLTFFLLSSWTTGSCAGSTKRAAILLLSREISSTKSTTPETRIFGP